MGCCLGMLMQLRHNLYRDALTQEWQPDPRSCRKRALLSRWLMLTQSPLHTGSLLDRSAPGDPQSPEER